MFGEAIYSMQINPHTMISIIVLSAKEILVLWQGLLMWVGRYGY